MQQTATITIDNPDPDNWEGVELRRVKHSEWYLDKGQISLWCSSPETACEYLIMRRKQSPVEKWIADHPWIPEGLWVYRFAFGTWHVSDVKPVRDADSIEAYSHATYSHYCCAQNLAALFGHTFTPPPVNLVEIKRTP